MTDGRWQSLVEKAFKASPSALADRVRKKSFYLQGDATSAADLMRAIDAATGRVALYFALPPAVAALACAALAGEKMPSGIVLALEKPFGTDLASARALNRLLAELRRREAGVPGRSLPRQVDRAQPARAAVCQPHLRTAAQRAERRARRDRDRGGARPRGSRRLLRQGGRAGRHDPEPPAAGAGPGHHGAAVVHRTPKTCAARWLRRSARPGPGWRTAPRAAAPATRRARSAGARCPPTRPRRASTLPARPRPSPR